MARGSSPVQGAERRRCTRFPCEGEVTMHGFGAYRAALLDVSLKGVLVARPADCLPAPGSRATLEIRLDGSERVIRTDATVARSSDGLLAFSCHGLDLESAAELRRLVELNLGDETLLERELEALAD